MPVPLSKAQLPARAAEAGGEKALPPGPPEPPGHVAMQEPVLETGLRKEQTPGSPTQSPNPTASLAFFPKKSPFCRRQPE